MEFAARGITVNAVAPGFIGTDMTAKITPEALEKYTNSIPVQRIGQPKDVANAVAFLVSLLVIKFLMGYIRKHDFKVFGWYRIVLGIVVILYFALV